MIDDVQLESRNERELAVGLVVVVVVVVVDALRQLAPLLAVDLARCRPLAEIVEVTVVVGRLLEASK